MSLKLRPGVYATYEVSSSSANDAESALVGIAAAAQKGEAALITNVSQASERFGECSLAKLIRSAMLNGATRVYAVPLGDGDYGAAFAELIEHDADFLCCDSTDGESFADIAQTLSTAGEAGRFLIAVLEYENAEAQLLINKAKSINAENVMLIGNAGDTEGQLSAAAAGILSARRDPALPVNGVALKGVTQLKYDFTDAEIELLLESGVTPLEMFCGEACFVRGVSTRTMTGGVTDATYRDINTAMVINRVLPTVRDALRRRFIGRKNDTHTKAAIRSLVATELQKLKKAETIAAYGNIAAEASEDDPGICVVSFDFSVSKGLHIIELTAHVNL